MRMVTVTLSVSLTLFLFSCSEALSSDGGRSVYKDGDFMLQGLFPITYLDNGRCERVEVQYGLSWMVAMMYVVNEINNSGFLFGKTLGYRIDNTCFNIPTAMNHAITVVSEHRPNSMCREKYVCQGIEHFPRKRVLAVIGPAISWISIPVASLLGLYSIPQISYASTSRILSDKSRYKSFLRTIPSDGFQAQAMADFVQFFHWNYIYILASDDDYGKMGAASFKAAARKLGLCISNDEYISFAAENSEQLISSAISNLKKAKRAKVVIVFSYLYQGEKLLIEAQKQNITDRTWVTSDAWGTKTAKLNISKQLLNGIFTFASAARRIPKLERYIGNLTVDSVKGNEWLESYLSQEFGCHIRGDNILPLNMSSQRYCNLSKNLPFKETFTSMINENSGNVIDAVYAIAHGIRDIFNCKGIENANYCMGNASSIQTDDLLKSIKHTNFKSVYGTPIKFDENGEKMFREYTIHNFQITPSGATRYVQIGNWVKDGQRPVNFSVNTTLIAWNSGKRPVSTCFRECQPGERVVGKSECCWNCQRCPKGSVSSVKGASACLKCNETYYANKERTECALREVIYLTYADPAGVSIITISVFGLVLTSAIAVFVARLRDTALVRDSSPLLLSVFIMTLMISFLFSICYVLTKPSNHSCATLNSLFVLLQMLYAVFLLAKTRQANQWLRSAVSHTKIKVRMAYAQLISVCIFLLLQIILITLWQSTNPTVAHYINEYGNARLLECSEGYSVLRILATVFPFIILATATLIAFKERNIPENFNEAKFISFSSLALCIVVIAFFPTYRYVRGISKVLVVTFTSFIAAFSCMGCVFIPKIYVILFKAENDSSEFHHNCIANSLTTLPEHCSSATETIHKSHEYLVDSHAREMEKNTEATKYDASLSVNGRTHSKLSLQERFNLETLDECDFNEDVCKPCPSDSVGVAESQKEARSIIPKVETIENTEVLSSNNPDSGEIAREEFLL